MIVAPCKDCQGKRDSNGNPTYCYRTCIKYQDFRKQLDEVKKRERNEISLHAYFIDKQNRFLKRR